MPERATPFGPVLILQNLSSDGPGHLGTWLRSKRIAFQAFDTEVGHAYPASIGDYRALALLGGEMSANDALPSLRAAERLILQAMDADVPVIGHCLGGQLMARALGAAVRASPAPEIGWQRVQVADTPVARGWFGAPRERTVFHWHHESFDLPRGAELLASSAACPHQAFAIGRHLALQFHVELDAHKLATWTAAAGAGHAALQAAFPSVQSVAAMRAQAAEALGAQQRFAERLYGRWLGLPRSER
jgi:GMP synthase (glutamine-hydrolysing)